jgi:hypothetical protein
MTTATKPCREAVLRISEAEVVRRVMEYLSLKGIPSYRMNSGAFRTASGGFVRFGAKGMGNIYAIGTGGSVGVDRESASVPKAALSPRTSGSLSIA